MRRGHRPAEQAVAEAFGALAHVAISSSGDDTDSSTVRSHAGYERRIPCACRICRRARPRQVDIGGYAEPAVAKRRSAGPRSSSLSCPSRHRGPYVDAVGNRKLDGTPRPAGSET